MAAPLLLAAARAALPSLLPMPAPRFHVLIPCAGSGSRAGGDGPKQYRQIAGQPMVAHTVDAFRALGARFATLALVVVPDDREVSAALPHFPEAGERLLRVGG